MWQNSSSIPVSKQPIPTRAPQLGRGAPLRMPPPTTGPNAVPLQNPNVGKSQPQPQNSANYYPGQQNPQTHSNQSSSPNYYGGQQVFPPHPGGYSPTNNIRSHEPSNTTNPNRPTPLPGMTNATPLPGMTNPTLSSHTSPTNPPPGPPNISSASFPQGSIPQSTHQQPNIPHSLSLNPPSLNPPNIPAGNPLTGSPPMSARGMQIPQYTISPPNILPPASANVNVNVNVNATQMPSVNISTQPPLSKPPNMPPNTGSNAYYSGPQILPPSSAFSPQNASPNANPSIALNDSQNTYIPPPLREDDEDDYEFEYDDNTIGRSTSLQIEDAEEMTTYEHCSRTDADTVAKAIVNFEIEMQEMARHLTLYQQTLLGIVGPQDVAVAFRGFDFMVETHKEFLKTIQQQFCDENSIKNTPTAAIFSTSIGTKFFNAYHEFLSAHEVAAQKLFTFSSHQTIIDLAQKCGGWQIMDLFGFLVRRVPIMCQLYRIQADVFYKEKQLTFLVDSITSKSFKSFTPVTLSILENLQGLEALSAASQRIEGVYTAKDAFSNVDLSENVVVPTLPDRKLVLDESEGISLFTPNAFEFGLAMHIPVRLILFHDGLALCARMHQHQKQTKYTLLEWRSFEQMILVDGHEKSNTTANMNTNASSHILTIEMRTDTPSGLLPGWELARNADTFYYMNRTTQQTTIEAPRVPPRRIFSFTTKEHKQKWLDALANTAKVSPVSYEKYSETVRIFRRQILRQTFSVPLEILVEKEQTLNINLLVPIVTRVACHHLIQSGLAEEGIFRVAPENRVLEECIQAINEGKIFETDFKKYPVHVCSGVLKHFLRNLPDALLQSSLYQEWMRIFEFPTNQQIAYARSLIARLSPYNYHLMRELFGFLRLVAENSHTNKMLVSNLAIVTAPNILHDGQNTTKSLEMTNLANDVVTLLIQNSEFIFDNIPPVNLRRVLFADFVTFQNKLIGHSKSVRAVCPNKRKRVWSIDSDGIVFEWTMNGKFSGTFATECKTPLSIELIKGNMWIGSPSGVVIVDAQTHQKRTKIPHFEALSILYIASLNSVWIGADSKIMIADADSLTMCENSLTVPEDGVIFTMGIVGDTVWAAGTIGRKGGVFIFDTKTNSLITHFIAHDKKVSSILCLGNKVWTASDDSTICIWDAQTFNRIAKLERHSGRVNQLCFVGDQVWSCSWDKRIIIWHARKFSFIGEITGYHTDNVIWMRSLYSRSLQKWDVWSASFDSICLWQSNALPFFV